MPTEQALIAERVSKSFGGTKAVIEADARVEPGQIVALIGPNGAGKTTLLNCLAGNEALTSGHVLLNGKDISRWSSHRRAAAGVRRTFQHARPFPSMTLLENTMISLGRATRYSTLQGLLRLRSYHRGEDDLRAVALAALERVGLVDMADHEPGALPAGQQRLAEVARTYAAHPQFLLLDEPTSGLDSVEADELFQLLRDFRSEGAGLIVVEHRIQTVAELADQMIVMDQGRVVASGSPSEVRASQTVVSAYMGVGK